MGLALAGLVAPPRVVLAQGGERSVRWEIPGFDISRDGGWRVKGRRVASARALLLAQGAFSELNAPMRAAGAGPSLSSHAITGTFQVPMVLFFYQNTDSAAAVRDTSQYNALLFGDAPPFSRPYTLKTYYGQLSNNLFTMLGRSIGWAKLDSSEVAYTGNPATTTCTGNGTMCNGLFSSDARQRMQRGLREALAKVDGGVDFALYDNDGEDGAPNSGDDDGYVDMMGFAHAHRDGACGGSGNNHIWAHRWVLGGGDGAGDYITNDARGGGGPGNIRIRDYFIQSALGGPGSCDSTQIMPIGTAAHEFGHALGLPDLYDTQGSSEGIGRWGLMGSGNYSSPDSPARMGAWSLNQLGWVTVVPLDTTGTYSFGAGQTSDTVFLVNVPTPNPRSEHFLLENRQAALADTATIRNGCQVWHQPANVTDCPGGFLIWHIDGSKVSSGTSNNQVNAGSIHGVKLEEADGERSLWCLGPAIPHQCSRGDAGDAYPGITGNTAFHLTSNPAALKNQDGSYIGFDIDQITQVTPGATMSFRLTFDTTPALVVTTTSPRPGAVMGAVYADTLVATGGTGTYAWSLFSGQLPPGVALAANGALSGRPRANGNFTFTVRVSSGGQIQSATYSIAVTSPALVLANVLARLFDPLSTTLSADEIFYLDYLGNSNGQLDVGDFKAWRDAGGGS